MTLNGNLIFLVFLLLGLYVITEAQRTKPPGVDTFYVSTNNGNDKWSGHVPDPSVNGTDGPFKTIGGAVKAIRIQRRKNPVASVRIFLRGGVYRIKKLIVMNKKDAGTTILNYNEEKVDIVGSSTIQRSKLRRIKRMRGDNGVQLYMYRAKYKGKCSMNAFIGDKRLVRARKPNLREWTGENLSGEGPYLYIKDLLVSTKTCDKRAKRRFRQDCPEEDRWGFRFKNRDLSDNWLPSIQSSQGVDVVIFQAWTAERGTIESINSKNFTVKFRKPLRHAVGSHPKPSGWRYIVENVKSELDAPGEYFCDEKRKEFFVVLPSSYELGTQEINIGTTSRFFKVKKSRDITFRGLNFKYSDNKKGFQGYNEAMATVQFHECVNVTVTQCSFQHIGYSGVYIVSTKNINVQENYFKDIGYIGISVDYKNNPTSPTATENAIVSHNKMTGCGVVNMFQPCCIHVRGMRNINVAWNHIQRISYSGIRVGWQKMFEIDHVKEGEYVFTVENNHVHHHGMGILNDFGGIYLATNAEDCKIKQDLSLCNAHALIKHNVVHSGKSFYYGGSGVFGDAATSSLHIVENWLYDVGDSEVIFHCGQRNIAQDNVIYHTSSHKLFGTCNPSMGQTGRMPVQTFSFLRNVIYISNPKAVMWRKNDAWINNDPIFRDNIYYFAPTSQDQSENFFPKRKSWEEWHQNGEQDTNSIITDPLFMNITTKDFRFQPTSPASRLPVYRLDLRYVRDMMKFT